MGRVTYSYFIHPAYTSHDTLTLKLRYSSIDGESSMSTGELMVTRYNCHETACGKCFPIV